MPTPDLAPCFGFEFLGMCRYDPQAPSPSYFTIGDAVAALAFTLAVQQFLKPIYQFRLRAMGIRFSHIVWSVFVGSFLTVIAAAVPGFELFRGTPFGYPVNWEIAGGLIVGASYLIVAIISLKPAVVTPRNVERFHGAGAFLLSAATDEDRLSFAQDVLSGRNIQTLVQIAAEFARGERHALVIALEKLREEGREREGIRGRPKITSFYAFTRRRELNLANHAWHFLQLLSDKDFCRVVITRHSWGFLRAIIPIVEENLYAEAAQAFVQAVAWQSLLQEEGMLAREDGYEGFGLSRGFATEFYGNYKMRVFDPLNGISSIGFKTSSSGFVSRLNIAARLMVKSEIEHQGFWDSRSTISVVNLYENIASDIRSERWNGATPKYLSDLRQGIIDLSMILIEELEKSDARTFNSLFAENLKEYRTDIVDDIAKLVSEGLFCISNKFQGVEDPAWLFAHEIITKIFERWGDVALGLSPFQQAVAVRLVEKLKQNMKGYYPTVSRVLLATLGPYETNAPAKPGSAVAILKDAIYFEFRSFPELYNKDPEKALERLPPNVSYDHQSGSLIHTYSSGNEVRTVLNDLNIDAVDLLAKKNLRRKT